MQINSSYMKPNEVVTTSNVQGKKQDEVAEAAPNESAPKSGVSERDFSSMTNSDLYEWMQSKHAKGEISPKESWTALYMMMDIPVGGLEEGQTMAIDDTTPVDFFKKINDGMAWAKSEQDHDTSDRLESLLGLMKRDQEKGVNVFT